MSQLKVSACDDGILHLLRTCSMQLNGTNHCTGLRNDFIVDILKPFLTAACDYAGTYTGLGLT